MKILNSIFLAFFAIGIHSAPADVIVGAGDYTYDYLSNTGSLDPNATNVNVTPRNLGFGTFDRYSTRDNGVYGDPSSSSITYTFLAPTGYDFTAADVFYRDQSNAPGGVVTASYSIDGGLTFAVLSIDTGAGTTAHGPSILSIDPGTASVIFKIAGSRTGGDPGELNYFGQGDTGNTTPGFEFKSTTEANVIATPEPATAALILVGVGVLFCFHRFRRLSA